jgi:hypothetical protein
MKKATSVTLPTHNELLHARHKKCFMEAPRELASQDTTAGVAPTASPHTPMTAHLAL